MLTLAGTTEPRRPQGVAEDMWRVVDSSVAECVHVVAFRGFGGFEGFGRLLSGHRASPK